MNYNTTSLMRITKHTLAIGLLSSFIFIISCCKSQDIPPKQFSDMYQFKKEWKSIESLESKGLLQSALDTVLFIKNGAITGGNQSHWLKAIIFENKLRSQLEEDGFTEAVLRMTEGLDRAEEPATSILHSMIAEKYAEYAMSNQHRFSNRTAIEGEEGDDIRTWSLKRIWKESDGHYNRSLQNPEMLREYPITDFEAILTEEKNTRELRPTVYDFLAHRYIDNHTSGQRDHDVDPSGKYFLDKRLFLPYGDFLAVDFEFENSRISSSLNVFRDLLGAHISKENINALIHVDLKRLNYVMQKSKREDKDELYIAALEALFSNNKKHSASAEVLYYQANHINSKAQQNESLTIDDEKWSYERAMALCTEAIQHHKDSYGADMAHNLKAQIERKEINLRGENSIASNSYSKVHVYYRNTSTVRFKIIPINDTQLTELRLNSRRNILEKLSRLVTQKEWTQSLPSSADYKSHTVEVKVDPLAKGSYVIMAEGLREDSNSDFSQAYSILTVTDLTFWTYPIENSMEIQVVDRTTGAAISNAKISVYKRVNSNNQSELSLTSQENSDANGRYRIPFAERNYFIKVEKDGDMFFPWENFYRQNNHNRNLGERAVLFTDRAIYRPNQIVHYKLVATQYDGNNMPSAIPNRNVRLQLIDPNGEEVGSSEAKTDMYGTLSGNFSLPSGRLNGSWSIRANGVSLYKMIRVEEYKRPNFEVNLDSLQKQYVINDQVEAKGIAKSYSGYGLAGADVRYRIYRGVDFPYLPWEYRYCRRYFGSKKVLLTTGSIIASDDGRFTIPFEAIPDLSIPKNARASFRYTIEVDAVDINGETQSTTRTYNIGAVSVNANWNVRDLYMSNTYKDSEIKFVNLDGQSTKASGSLEIFSLVEPEQYFRTRPWQKPDQNIYGKEEFKKWFPNDPYKDEDQIETWVEEKLIKTVDFNDVTNLMIDIPQEMKQSGAYRFKLSISAENGENIEIVKNTRVLSENTTASLDNIWFQYLGKDEYEPGDTEDISLYFSSSVNRFKYKGRKNSLVFQNQKQVSGLETLNEGIVEGDYGGYSYFINFQKDNRYYSRKIDVQVPWKNKELTIELETFRSKLKPGEKEEYTVTVRDNKGKAINTSLLAGMYDASLDAFVAHGWNAQSYYPSTIYHAQGPRSLNEIAYFNNIKMDHNNKHKPVQNLQFHMLNWFGWYSWHGGYEYMRGDMVLRESGGRPEPTMGNKSRKQSMPAEDMELERDGMNAPAATEVSGIMDEDSNNKEVNKPKIRSDFAETVFFYPELNTDDSGSTSFKFTMRESLTKWKLMLVAHSKDRKTGDLTKELVTQKDLLSELLAPRFLREGDKVSIPTKLTNLSEKAQSGTIRIEILDENGEIKLHDKINLTNSSSSFSLAAGESKNYYWRLELPDFFVQPLLMRVIAEGTEHQDGEERLVPVLSNKVLITEALPLSLRKNETKKFSFDSYIKKQGKPSIKTHAISVEFSSNPAWYAVQSLPYLRDFPHECAEQLMSKFYSNALAAHVANSNPKIKRVFEKWQGAGDLKSFLNKNQDLKNALIEETPWLITAKSEEETMRNIALLFDLNKMGQEARERLTKLSQMQNGDGGFPWFSGGRSSRHISLQILELWYHLDDLGVLNAEWRGQWENTTARLESYLERELKDEYKRLEESVAKGFTKWSDDHLSSFALHYLYLKALQKSEYAEGELGKIQNYYFDQGVTYWTKRGLFEQGLIGIILHQKDHDEVKTLLKSLKERTIVHPEIGTYWKGNWGYGWYNRPIETHALMIELFEKTGDEAMVEELQIWLLKNKQTNNWKTTKATTRAIYALLIAGDDWLSNNEMASVMIDKEDVAAEADKDAGSLYFRVPLDDDMSAKSMENITVTNPNDNIAWGAVYWQYFDDLDKVDQFEDTPLKLTKKLFVKKPKQQERELVLLPENQQLEPGDEVVVRITLEADREMSFLHMKDYRAGGLEPMTTLSGYKWQGGLGYYQSTKDMATHFFIDRIVPGKYVFEYSLRCVHPGDFSNGTTMIESMYAPEFRGHSEGRRLLIKER